MFNRERVWRDELPIINIYVFLYRKNERPPGEGGTTFLTEVGGGVALTLVPFPTVWCTVKPR